MVVECKLSYLIEEYYKLFYRKHFPDALMRCNYDSVLRVVRKFLNPILFANCLLNWVPNVEARLSIH
jgi:hypothetical protein